MRVLVTGGAGYIGSHTANLLAQRGIAVVALDTLAHGHRAALRDVPLVVGDAGDAALVERVIGEHAIDTAIHFAAVKSVEESVADPVGTFEANVAATIGLLAGLERAGVRRLVFSSTAAVYGTPDALPVTEDAPIRPDNPYGESKALVERMLEWLDRAGHLRFVSLRYFNAAGAAPDGDNGEDWRGARNLVPLVMAVAVGRLPELAVFGTDYPTPDGTAVRDYVHVVDLAEAHVAALEHLERGGPSTVLNVGTGTGASVREVVDVARRVTGRAIPVREAARRPGDPAAVWAATDRAHEVLGWRARHDLEAIVSSAWAWASRHPDGFADAPPEAGR